MKIIMSGIIALLLYFVATTQYLNTDEQPHEPMLYDNGWETLTERGLTERILRPPKY